MEAPALPTLPQEAPEVLAQQITLLHMECSYHHNVITEVKFPVDTDTLNLFWRTHIVSSVRKIFYISSRKTPPKIQWNSHAPQIIELQRRNRVSIGHPRTQQRNPWMI